MKKARQMVQTSDELIECGPVFLAGQSDFKSDGPGSKPGWSTLLWIEPKRKQYYAAARRPSILRAVMKTDCDFTNLIITIQCENFDEFVATMKQVRETGGSHPAAGKDTVDSPQQPTKKSPVLSESTLRKVLLRIQGQKSARFLWALANSPGYSATDVQIREAIPDATTLAPFASHIAKACKMAGIEVGDVLAKRARRGIGGKIDYRYTLNDECAKAVLGIPRFVDELPEMPEMDWD